MTPARGPPRFHTEDELINSRRYREDIKDGLRTVLMRQEGHTETHRDMQGHTQTRRDTQRHTGTQRHTEDTHRDTQGHTEDTQGHTEDK